MREMPHGQWVAFGGYDSVHVCGRASEYDLVSSASSHRHSTRKREEHTAPAARPLSPPESAPHSASGTHRSQQPWPNARRNRGWPAWVGWLLAIVVLYLLLKI